MFAVGQRIVCVRDDFLRTSRGQRLILGAGITLPKKARFYHIRGITPPNSSNVQCDFLWLVEIRNSIHPGCDLEPAFASCYFRPVIECRTDISVFTALLNPAPPVRTPATSDPWGTEVI